MAYEQIITDDAGWIGVHTERASRVWERMVQAESARDCDGKMSQVWENRWYEVIAARFADGWFTNNGPYWRLGIGNKDKSAAHDWRDFQRIKSDLCGPEWEAIELYPAESRLVDPSNYFYLWVVPAGVLQFGFDHRRVLHPKECTAPQRPFGAGAKDYQPPKGTP